MARSLKRLLRPATDRPTAALGILCSAIQGGDRVRQREGELDKGGPGLGRPQRGAHSDAKKAQTALDGRRGAGSRGSDDPQKAKAIDKVCDDNGGESEGEGALGLVDAVEEVEARPPGQGPRPGPAQEAPPPGGRQEVQQGQGAGPGSGPGEAEGGQALLVVVEGQQRQQQQVQNRQGRKARLQVGRRAREGALGIPSRQGQLDRVHQEHTKWRREQEAGEGAGQGREPVAAVDALPQAGAAERRAEERVQTVPEGGEQGAGLVDGGLAHAQEAEDGGGRGGRYGGAQRRRGGAQSARKYYVQHVLHDVGARRRRREGLRVDGRCRRSNLRTSSVDGAV